MKRLVVAIAALALAPVFAADPVPRSFAEEVENYLAEHPVAGLETYADFCRLVAQPPAQGAVDATVPSCLKERRIRFWGALEHMELFRDMGLDAAEFDPDAAADGDWPDVVFCFLEPGFSKGDVSMMLAWQGRRDAGGTVRQYILPRRHDAPSGANSWEACSCSTIRGRCRFRSRMPTVPTRRWPASRATMYGRAMMCTCATSRRAR